MRSIKSIHRVVLVALFALLFLPPSSQATTTTTINPLTGAYYGTATITAGNSSLGTIDLSFYLDLSANGTINNATSYISLDKTLLFPVVAPQVGGIDVGPRVSGTVTSSSFSLISNNFTSVSTAIGTPITRKITLSSTIVTNGGNSIEGAYAETITNLGKNPITVTGTFKLAKPIVSAPKGLVPSPGDSCIDLDAIRAGGNDPNVIEFIDLSTAYDLYMTPAKQPNLCAPPETLLQSALQEYFGTLQ